MLRVLMRGVCAGGLVIGLTVMAVQPGIAHQRAGDSGRVASTKVDKHGEAIVICKASHVGRTNKR